LAPSDLQGGGGVELDSDSDVLCFVFVFGSGSGSYCAPLPVYDANIMPTTQSQGPCFLCPSVRASCARFLCASLQLCDSAVCDLQCVGFMFISTLLDPAQIPRYDATAPRTLAGMHASDSTLGIRTSSSTFSVGPSGGIVACQPSSRPPAALHARRSGVSPVGSSESTRISLHA
jgi:hypothetical protein